MGHAAVENPLGHLPRGPGWLRLTASPGSSRPTRSSYGRQGPGPAVGVNGEGEGPPPK
jgi:hypothetical protein